jgi:hypothetical protein
MSAIKVNNQYPFEFETVRVDDNVVMRGGDFNDFPTRCRSASRQLQTPERYSR